MLRNQHYGADRIGLWCPSSDRLAAFRVYVAITLRGLLGAMFVGFAGALIGGVPARAQDDAATIALPTRVDPSTEQLLIGVEGSTTVPLVFRTNPSVPFVAVHVDLPDGSGRDLQTLVDTAAPTSLSPSSHPHRHGFRSEARRQFFRAIRKQDRHWSRRVRDVSPSARSTSQNR
jgi:hypothetical protein